MKFVMTRDHTVASTAGYAIEFKAGVPAHVPRAMHREVVAAGAVATDGDEVEFETKPKAAGSPDDAIERAEMIKMALADILERNVREEFTATGVPKIKGVEKMVGFEVSSREVGELWTEMNQAKGE